MLFNIKCSLIDLSLIVILMDIATKIISTRRTQSCDVLVLMLIRGRHHWRISFFNFMLS